MLVVQGRGPTMPGRTEATAAGGLSTRYPRRQLFALPASLDQVQMRACAPRPSPGDILFAPPPRLNLVRTFQPPRPPPQSRLLQHAAPGHAAVQLPQR